MHIKNNLAEEKSMIIKLHAYMACINMININKVRALYITSNKIHGYYKDRE